MATSHRRGTRGRPIDVFVLDAQYRQALATMRTLSRSGSVVGAVACRADSKNALALESRWCELGAVVPDFSDDPPGYVDAICALLDAHPARLIVPCHDGSIETLRSRRVELERRTALPLASDAALDVALSKTRTLAAARHLGLAIPRSVFVADSRDVSAAIRHVGYPAVIKPSISWATRHGAGTRLACECVNRLSDAQRTVEKINAAGARAIIQQWVSGERVAVTLFHANDRIWTRFVQKSYRELPVLGGASVLCESLPPLPDLVAPAERLIRGIGLDGCSMVEFRRDRSGQPLLMEVNPRLPGSVMLAIACGVDFPQLLHDWALGEPLHPIDHYAIGRRLRWVAGDLWSLWSSLRRVEQPDTETPLKAALTFLYDFVRRPGKLDLVDRRDMMPALAELRQMIWKPAFRRFHGSLEEPAMTAGGTPELERVSRITSWRRQNGLRGGTLGSR